MTGPVRFPRAEPDLAQLRGGFNDLVGLLAVSAAWAGNGAAEVVRMLSDALCATLSLDFVLVELDPLDGQEGLEHLAGGSARHLAADVARALRAAWGEDRAGWPAAARCALFGPDISLATLPLGRGDASGTIVAAAARHGFPNEIEKLLLNVARNQAVLALQEAGRRNEEQQRASELGAAAVIEGIPGLVAVLDPNGRVERINRRIADYCGQTLQELRDWGTNGTVHPDDLPHVAEVFGSSIASGTPYDIEQRLRRFDGAYRWFRNQGSPLRDEAGTVLAWHVLLTDIDDRRRAEDSLRARAQELRQQAETFPQMLWSATANGNIDYCNERLLAYSGMTIEEVRDGGWVRLLHPDDREATANVWMGCIATGAPYSVEVRHFNCAEQTYRWNLTMALPLRDDEGRVAKWYGSCVDIDDLKRAQQAIKANERRLAQIIDAIPANVWSADAQGGMDFHNRHYRDYLGSSAGNRQDTSWTSVVHAEDIDALIAAWERALASGELFEAQARIRRADGTYRWFLNRASAVEDAEGRIRWFGISIDIEDMKQAGERLRESELALRRQTETIPQNLFGADAAGSVDYLNTQLREWFGRAEETIMAEEWVHLVHPEDRGATIAAWTGTVAAGSPYRHEVRFLDRNGEYRWCDVKARPLRDADGAITAWYGVLNDINDRKLAEDALRASEENLRLTIDTIPALAWSARVDGTADFFNRHYLDYVGRTLAEQRDWGWMQCVHPDDLPVVSKAWQSFSAAGEGGEVEARLRRSDGAYRWFSFRAHPLRDARGNLVKWYGVKVEIDEQKRMTTMLAHERELLELIASGRPLLEVLGRLCKVVESALPDRRCEVRTLDGTGTIFRHVVAPSLPAAFTAGVAGSAVDADASPSDLAVAAKEQVAADDLRSDPRWEGMPARSRLLEQGLAGLWSGPIVSREGGVIGSLSVLGTDGPLLQSGEQDIVERAIQIASIAIERWRAEDELRRREYLLETAEQISEAGWFYWDLDNDKLVWSRQMYRIWEVDESIEPKSVNLLPRVHPDDRPLVEERIARGLRGEDLPRTEERYFMPDGRMKYVSGQTMTFQYEDGRRECVGVAQDITRRRMAENALDEVRSELAHVTRVTSLGELTASIAHEVNQPLAGIITNANTCLRLLTAEQPDVEGAIRTAQRTLRDGDRASQVIQRLRGMFRKQDFHAERLDLNAAAQEVIAICTHDLQRRRIALQVQLDPGLPEVMGDRIQLQQVILNLVLNAADAIDAAGGALRQVRVESGTTSPGLVQLTVSDTGIGISAEDEGRLFDAFFTTKAKGMGIGLSVSRSILERHHGRIWAAANAGPGATFGFALAAAPEDIASTGCGPGEGGT